MFYNFEFLINQNISIILKIMANLFILNRILNLESKILLKYKNHHIYNNIEKTNSTKLKVCLCTLGKKENR